MSNTISQITLASGQVSRLDVALWLARIGFWICPLEPNGKGPLVAGSGAPREICGGAYKATRDEKTIRRWFALEPNLNFGIVASRIVQGAEDYMNIIDFDLHKNAKPLSVFAASLLQRVKRKLEDCVYQKTPNGGRHIFVRTRGFRLNNTSDVQGIKGLDVRGAQGNMPGGWVVGDSSCVPRDDGTIGTYVIHFPTSFSDVSDILELTLADARALGLPIFGETPNSKPKNATPQNNGVAGKSQKSTEPPIISPLTPPVDFQFVEEHVEFLILAHYASRGNKEFEDVGHTLASMAKNGQCNFVPLYRLAIRFCKSGGAKYDHSARARLKHMFRTSRGERTFRSLVHIVKEEAKKLGLPPPLDPDQFGAQSAAQAQKADDDFDKLFNGEALSSGLNLEKLEMIINDAPGATEAARVIASAPEVRRWLRFDTVNGVWRVYDDTCGVWREAFKKGVGISPTEQRVRDIVHRAARDVDDDVRNVENRVIDRLMQNIQSGNTKYDRMMERIAVKMHGGTAPSLLKNGTTRKKLQMDRAKRLQAFEAETLKILAGMPGMSSDRFGCNERTLEFADENGVTHTVVQRIATTLLDCHLLTDGRLVAHSPDFLAIHLAPYIMGFPAGADPQAAMFGWELLYDPKRPWGEQTEARRNAARLLYENKKSLKDIAKAAGCLLTYNHLLRLCNGDEAVAHHVLGLYAAWFSGRSPGHRMLIFFGAKRSGKSVFLRFMLVVFGCESGTMSADAFYMIGNNEQTHGPAWVKAIGNPVVFIEEAEPSGAPNFSRAKRAIAEGSIDVRQHYENHIIAKRVKTFFTADCNDLPDVKNSTDGEALLERWDIVEVPKHLTTLREHRDPTLQDKLRSEAAGVAFLLCLMRDEVHEYSELPEAIQHAKQRALWGRDGLGSFIGEKCDSRATTQPVDAKNPGDETEVILEAYRHFYLNDFDQNCPPDKIPDSTAWGFGKKLSKIGFQRKGNSTSSYFYEGLFLKDRAEAAMFRDLAAQRKRIQKNADANRRRLMLNVVP